MDDDVRRWLMGFSRCYQQSAETPQDLTVAVIPSLARRRPKQLQRPKQLLPLNDWKVYAGSHTSLAQGLASNGVGGQHLGLLHQKKSLRLRHV